MEALNPILKYDLRRAGRSYNPEQRLVFTALVLIGFLMGAIIIIIADLETLSGLFLLAGIAFGFAADNYYSLYLVNNIHQEVVAGRWEMLRLTAIDEEQILLGKCRFGEFSCYWLMMLEIGIKMMGVLSWCWFNLRPSVSVYRNYDDLTIAAMIVILAFYYIVEPVWRMPALVALGAKLGMVTNHIVFATVGAIRSILLTRIAQVAMVMIVSWICFAFPTFALPILGTPNFSFLRLLAIPVIFILASLLTSGFYSGERKSLIAYTANFMRSSN